MNNIIIVNQKDLDNKIASVKKDGILKLHILSDFDRTLTRCWVNGKQSSTSWAQFRNLGIFGKEYADKSKEQFDYYRPIEVDVKLSLEQKSEKMQEWWEKHLELLVQSGLTNNELDLVIKRGGITLREGIKEFLNSLKENKIPLVIISAGLGDLIKGVLNREKLMNESVNIISNFFEFNKNGEAIGFKENIIHSMNKHETELKLLPIYNNIEKRKNVILLGDCLDDLGMSQGFNYKILIKIGFLNEDVNKNLNLYKKNFDVIITNDGSMDYVNKLLEGILKK